MGCSGSVPADVPSPDMDKSHKIDQHNLEDYRTEKKKIKVLLLGAGESGKTTIRKQMSMVYGKGFTDHDRMDYRRHVWTNIVEGMQELCHGVETLNLHRSLQAKAEFETVVELRSNATLTPAIGATINTLWHDPAIQAAWERRVELQVFDTAKLYFERIAEIAREDYIPSVEDIILARVRSTGIVVDKYNMEGTPFELFDVGGQRNERKKWMHCFDGVDAVIFVTAISEFDQVMFEDDSMNRMVEALTLFEEICNSTHFTNASVFLFLNKGDLYREKIQRVSIESVPCFKDYEGAPNSYEDGIEYFRKKFQALNRNPAKKIPFHVTCAIDLSSVQTAFDACKDLILERHRQAEAAMA